MKKSIPYTAIAIMVILLSCENEEEISASEVPQPVMSAFQSKYPDISPEKWEKENEKGKVIYEATFRNENKEVEAGFDENGNFIEEE